MKTKKCKTEDKTGKLLFQLMGASASVSSKWSELEDALEELERAINRCQKEEIFKASNSSEENTLSLLHDRLKGQKFLHGCMQVHKLGLDANIWAARMWEEVP